MKINDFNIMKWKDKVELLCSEAVILGERTDGCFTITLLQLENFYVEIYFHELHGSVKNIRSFSDTEDLAIYLEQVDISELISS